MVVLYIFIAFYLLAGFFYAAYITWLGVDPWYTFPVNMLGGPTVLVINYILAKKGKLGPMKRSIN